MQPYVHTIKSVEPKDFKSMSLTTKYIFFLHAEMCDEITYIIHTYLLKGGKTMQSWTLWDHHYVSYDYHDRSVGQSLCQSASQPVSQ